MLKEWDYEENDKLGIKPNELLVGSIKKYIGYVAKVINMIEVFMIDYMVVEIAHIVEIEKFCRAIMI